MKKVRFDIMLGDRFLCTMTYTYCPAFKLTWDEIERYILEKRPSLKSKDYSVYFDDKDLNIYY